MEATRNDADRMVALKETGLRATPGRIAALRFLDAHPHSTVAQLHEGISVELPTLSMQSVHNVVNDLSARLLLRRLEVPGDGAARYETRTRDNHHHIRCVVCGRIEDVDCVVGEAPCLEPEPVEGMGTVLSAEITFRAICTDCEAAASGDTTATGSPPADSS